MDRNANAAMDRVRFIRYILYGGVLMYGGRPCLADALRLDVRGGFGCLRCNVLYLASPVQVHI